MWHLVQSIWVGKMNNSIYAVCLSMVAFVLGLGDVSMHLPIFPWQAQCIPGRGCTKYTPATFGEKIVAIECKVGKWDHPSALLASKDFLAIYQHPKYYYDHIWSVLESCWFTAQQKKIVVYAMEQLPLADYFSFVDKVYKTYPSGRLKEALFAILLGDQPIYKHPLIENKAAPELATLVEAIQHIGNHRLYFFETNPLNNNDYIDKIKLLMPKSIAVKETIESIVEAEKKKHNRAYLDIDHIQWLEYSDFVTLYTHPDCYIEEISDILQEPACTWPYYCIIAEAMINLSSLNCVKLIPIYAQAYLQGMLPGNKLHWCFMNLYSKHTNLVMDYRHPVVQSTLENILSTTELPVLFKLKIADIKSGKATIAKQAYDNHKQGARIIFHETIPSTRYWDTILMLCGILVVIVYYGRKLFILLDKVALRKDWR